MEIRDIAWQFCRLADQMEIDTTEIRNEAQRLMFKIETDDHFRGRNEVNDHTDDGGKRDDTKDKDADKIDYFFLL
ncbi:hypothetical protein FQN51_000988 [Onygenales sp. PD_10]|nr:hypothetical protein FQN51_000988 [Onygenales sp. PD_10]